MTDSRGADAPRLADRLATLSAHLHDTVASEDVVAHHYEIARDALAIAVELLAALRAEWDTSEGPWTLATGILANNGPAVVRLEIGRDDPRNSYYGPFDTEAEAIAVRDALNALGGEERTTP